jgi:hypothetical protein
MILKGLTHVRLRGGLYSFNAYACCVAIVWGHIPRSHTRPSMVELLFVHRVCDELIINTKFVADLENTITKLSMRKSLQDIASACVKSIVNFDNHFFWLVREINVLVKIRVVL